MWRKLLEVPAGVRLRVVPDDQRIDLKLSFQAVGNRLSLLFGRIAAHMDPIAPPYVQINYLYPDI